EAVERGRRTSEAVTVELEGLLARLAERRLAVQRLELARDETVRRAADDFGADARALSNGLDVEPPLLDEGALSELEAHVRELRERLERLGPVNLESLGELEQLAERLGFLGAQRRDLEQARQTLADTVRRLDTESERRFLETFEEVREGFRIVFRQLFGGGRAEVVLSAGAAALDAGIEITARPRGGGGLP